MPASWSETAALVADVLDAPPEAREDLIITACLRPDGTLDRALGAEVRALVAAALDADASGALGSPARALLGGAVEAPEAGDRVGPWRIVEPLGEGGMGAVYRAERADGAYEREVALKRLRSGLGRRALAARLHAESLALGRLEHPGIARLYDGGVDADGVPYLVMEWVRGAPITAWASGDASGEAARNGVSGGGSAAEAPSTEARVRVFADACDAVAFAHARFVVHRDLKPSNLFVVQGERGPEPKLLDFGIAKILAPEAEPEAASGADSAADPLVTSGALTPAYAAPEQIHGGEITTATDVYALGVLLHEVLTGRRPPRASGDGADPGSRASAPEAGVVPDASLPADLAAIVRKASAAAPEARYESAAALAADLRRHLGALPVEAREPTLGYRLGRFVQRHRAGVAGTAVALLALLAVGGAAFARVSAERDRAEDEAARSAATSDFLASILAAPRSEARGRDVRVVDVLDDASRSVDSTLAGQPAALIEARTLLGNTYFRLGLFSESKAEFTRCVQKASLSFGSQSRDAASCNVSLAQALLELGDYDAADSLAALGLAVLRRELGETHEDVAFAWSTLATVRFDLGDGEGGADAARRALAIDEARLQNDPSVLPDVLVSMFNLANNLYAQGDLDAATALSSRALAMQAASGDSLSVSYARGLKDLGQHAYRAGDYARAERLQQRALRIAAADVGRDHPNTGSIRMAYGRALTALDRLEEGERHLREAASVLGNALGDANSDVGIAWEFLALNLEAQGRNREARDAARRARQIYVQALGTDHPYVADADAILARVGA